ncbi:MAG: chemotaxis protein CheR [Phenylobacterium zucineum]|nr:MAG: chemotaxis protein CheR [Phenylobacterium zucineum]
MTTPADRAFIAEFCLERVGLRLDPDKAYLIENRLAPVARREGFATSEAFLGALRESGDERLGWALAEAMVMPETEFFHDREVFDHLVDEVLPELAEARAGAPVRIWSAACGAGQEVYSLAMSLLDAPTPPGPVEIYASDLSERCLEKAQAGLYSQFEVQRGLPARKLVRHFEKDGESFALSPRVRQMVRWRRVNLMDDLARFGQFDLILCRSLISQLAPHAQTQVMGQLAQALAPGGRLVLGLKDRPAVGIAPVVTSLGLYELSAAA